MKYKEVGEPTASQKQTLATIIKERGGIGGELVLNVHLASNLGNTTALMVIPMRKFFDQSIVSNKKGASGENEIAQRSLVFSHAKKLAVYILKGAIEKTQSLRIARGEEPNPVLKEILDAIGSQEYSCLQPIVCNIRSINPDLSNVEGEHLFSQKGESIGVKIYLTQKHLLHVVDGQHRREGMKLVFEFLHDIQTGKKISKASLLAPYQTTNYSEFADAMLEVSEVAHKETTVQVECHLGLNVAKERQLFHDLNNLGKKIDKSLVDDFDLSNPVMPLVDAIMNNSNYSNLSYTKKEMMNFTSKLLLNRTNGHGIPKLIVESRKESAYSFWTAINKNIGNNTPEDSFLKSTALMKALSTLTYQYSFSKKEDQDDEKNLLAFIESYDFNLENPVFSILILSDEDIEKDGLQEVKKDILSIKNIDSLYCESDIENKTIIAKNNAQITNFYIKLIKSIIKNKKQ
jgi:hypothetical protein